MVPDRSAILSSLVLLWLICVSSLFSYGQLSNPLEQRISLREEQRSAKQILSVIHKKTRLTFNYKSGILPSTPIDLFTADNEMVSDILIRLLKPYNVEFKYFGGKSVVLKPVRRKDPILYTVSGYVFDKTNGEKLIGANVVCRYNNRSTKTNDHGFFSLTLTGDSVRLEVRYVGYSTYTEVRENSSNLFRVINLVPNTDLKEFVVHDEQEGKTEFKPGRFKFNLKAIKEIPSFMGEPDIIRSVQLLPGVQGAGESSGGINVRGGGTDQNLVLIDGVPVYNLVHVFGLFSIISPGAILSVELVKGGFSSRYNGRLSSILDVKLKDGNNQQISGSVNIGLLLSSVTLEGPLVKNKSSFLFSYRRTYFDAFYQPYQYFTSLRSINNYSGWYYFYDLNAKVHYTPGNRDKITLNFFTGSDRGKITEKQSFTDTAEDLKSRTHVKNLRWYTVMGSASWNHILTDKIFMVTTAGMTRYSTKFQDELNWETRPKPQAETASILYSQTSGNTDLFLKSQFEIARFRDHHIVTGVDLIYHRFNTGTLNYTALRNSAGEDTSIGDKNIYSLERVVFAEDNWKVNPKLSLTLGASYNAISVKDVSYHLFQPRLNGSYQLGPKLAISASFTRMQQNLQILPNNSVGLPVDIWIPVTNRLKPQTSDQLTAGMGYRIHKDYHFSMEAYYKRMDNLVELKEGSFFIFGGYEWDKSFYTGKGTARGLECILEKSNGKIKGWVSYSLSKSDRSFQGINGGKTFPFKYDRRHQVSAFIRFPQFRNRWNLSVSWIFSTGAPVTIPTSVYEIQGKKYYEFTDRNNVRMSSYHRMDIAFSKSKFVGRTKRTWNIGAYNLYSHLNPVFISTSFVNTMPSSGLKFYEVGLVPLIPFINYEISF